MASFQHKRNTINQIISGKEDIKQCVKSIMGTQKGSIPLMNNFGCDLMPVIGEKPEIAIDYLIGIYSKEIPKQEPRAEIVDVIGKMNEDGRLLMRVYYKEKSTSEIEYTEVYINVSK